MPIPLYRQLVIAGMRANGLKRGGKSYGFEGFWFDLPFGIFPDDFALYRNVPRPTDDCDGA
jgi:hypothetical protein